MKELLKENQQEVIKGHVLGLGCRNASSLASPLCPDEQIIFDAPPPVSPVEAGVGRIQEHEICTSLHSPIPQCRYRLPS